MIEILIVEDEQSYADTLEMIVEELSYRVAHVAHKASQAMSYFSDHPVDLVLMDVNLEGSCNGIELAHKFQKTRKTPIIFITALQDSATFDEALRSIPSAYITKPFKNEHLQRSIEVALKQAYGQKQNIFEENNDAAIAKDCVFVKDRNRLYKVKLEDILWIEVEDKYSMLYTAQKKYLLRQPLKELSEKLSHSSFTQIHRSVLVNINHIDNIDTTQSVVMVGETPLPLGKTYREDLLERINLL